MGPSPETPTSIADGSSPAVVRPPVAIGPVRDLVAGLDGPQRRAVTHGEGPLLVVAGPGTGKTEVITRRIAWLVMTGRARPSQILALTFTDRAADGMQARVDVLVPYGRADVAIHTFHAFGDRIIREHALAAGLTDAPRLLGRAEGLVLLREHLFELGLERYRPLADPTRFLGALLDLFARAKEEGVTPEAYAAFASELRAGALAAAGTEGDDGLRDVVAALLDEADGHAEVASAYGRYQALLRERSLVDFGDLVLAATALLRDRPAVRAALRARFRYLLVDETQDMNPLQAELVELLAAPDGNVTFVGDDDQAIYGFRGAAVETMLGLSGTYPAMRRVVLRRNHRSRRPILDAARRLIRRNDPDRLEAREGLDKRLLPARRTRRSIPVRSLGFETVVEEADHVADEIAARLARGTRPRDVAILVRTNADARPFLASLRVRGIPSRASGAAGLLAHAEARDALALLRAIADPDDPVDGYGALVAGAHGMPGSDLTEMLAWARAANRSPWAACRDVAAGRGPAISVAGRALVEHHVRQMDASIVRSHQAGAAAVLHAHLRESGWLGRLVARARDGDEEPLRRVARLLEVLQAIGAAGVDDRLAVIAPQLEALMESSDDPAHGEEGPEPEAVSVLTVHQAKGLEFPVVYIGGLCDGRFPMRARPARLPLPAPLLRRPVGAGGTSELAEERRLMFVAMTRARDELVLSHAALGVTGGRRRRASPFIAEALDEPAPVAGPRDLPARLTATPGTTEGRSDRPVGRPGGPRRALTLSFSQVDDYLTCPLRYHLRHELRVPTPPHHALVVGNALHQAMAAWYTARVRGRCLTDEELGIALDGGWQSQGFHSREHEEARYRAAREALARFAERERSAPGTRVLAVERPFRAWIGGDVVRGRLDLVTRGPDGVVITDHKSSDVRDLRRARERARESLQLALYAIAWERETGERPAAVALHFIDSGLTGAVAPDDTRAARAERQVTEAADGIRAGRFEAQPGLIACGYCPYRRICPASAAGVAGLA